MAFTDGIKWWPKVEIIKYSPATVAELTRDLGHEPSGPELRWLESRHGLVPDEITKAEGNVLVTAGLANITKLIIGSGGTAMTNAAAFVGVGDRGGSASNSAVAADADLTAIAGATHRWLQAADASNPTQSNGVITCNSTFSSANGNFAWNEWCWGVGTGTLTAGSAVISATAPFSTSNTMLNHATPASSLGTKALGASWTLQATITLS